MSGTSAQARKDSKAKEKRPPLTHFLCFPLVTETSLPLLESSLAEFKSNIPSKSKTPTDHPLKPNSPLFPDSAIRPLGTLHLTLGVMSLPTPQRVDDAVNLLHTLDIEGIIREVEVELRSCPDSSVSQQKQVSDAAADSLRPITVTLQSLQALPKAKAATVLYAEPVDPTSRLYPFGVKLRQLFVEAGFIEADYAKKPGRPGNRESQVGRITANDNDPETEASSYTKVREKPELRPLLLHATLVNTIYARDRHNKGKDRRRGRPLTFDAREILTHHHDFYTDGTCTERKVHAPSKDISQILDETSGGESNDENSSQSSEARAHPSRNIQRPQHLTHVRSNTTIATHPFIWARSFPIDKLCICEMGAKTIVGKNNPLAARLGQEYRVIAEKSLLTSNSGRV